MKGLKEEGVKQKREWNSKHPKRCSFKGCNSNNIIAHDPYLCDYHEKICDDVNDFYNAYDGDE